MSLSTTATGTMMKIMIMTVGRGGVVVLPVTEAAMVEIVATVAAVVAIAENGGCGGGEGRGGGGD